MKIKLTELMDELSDIVNTTPAVDCTDCLVRKASIAGNVPGMEALARLLVLENARRRHAEAKYESIKLQLQAGESQ